MSKRILHQAVEGMTIGDATSDHAFLLRRWLRDMGFVSDIFAVSCQLELEEEVRPFTGAVLSKETAVVFHHATGSYILDRLHEQAVPLIVFYHNITPPTFFEATDPALAGQLVRGREQLEKIKSQTLLALSASSYSELELESLGFTNTGVLPIVLDESRYDVPVDKQLQEECQTNGPILLFVGRLAPNKKQEDLIKLLYFYRRIEPSARLVLVGGMHAADYVSFLHRFAESLDLTGAITMAGHVTQQEMVTYYKSADLFVSMSEHEGFGKPLIESMYLELPVLAYASTAVPSTMGSAGVLFHDKNYEALAEAVDILIKDHALRSRIIDAQCDRVQAFLERNVRQQWQTYLEQAGILP